MLRLMLLRHAKSSWDTSGQPDFDRPLNERGRGAAPAMAAYMAVNGLMPARILCSAAQRAKETLALMLPHLDGDIDICIARRLYQADAPGYLEAMREFGSTEMSLMVIGHNPATEDIAHILAPVGDAAGLAAMKEKYPTAGLAVIGFDVPRWPDIGPGTGRLISFLTPKSIAGAGGAGQ
jgi:phosphohistidine phosphatase